MVLDTRQRLNEIGTQERPWTCGHDAHAQCAECYRILAHKAAALQAELDATEIMDGMARLRAVCAGVVMGVGSGVFIGWLFWG